MARQTKLLENFDTFKYHKVQQIKFFDKQFIRKRVVEEKSCRTFCTHTSCSSSTVKVVDLKNIQKTRLSFQSRNEKEKKEKVKVGKLGK